MPNLFFWMPMYVILSILMISFISITCSADKPIENIITSGIVENTRSVNEMDLINTKKISLLEANISEQAHLTKGLREDVDKNTTDIVKLKNSKQETRVIIKNNKKKKLNLIEKKYIPLNTILENGETQERSGESISIPVPDVETIAPIVPIAKTKNKKHSPMGKQKSTYLNSTVTAYEIITNKVPENDRVGNLEVKVDELKRDLGNQITNLQTDLTNHIVESTNFFPTIIEITPTESIPITSTSNSIPITEVTEPVIEQGEDRNHIEIDGEEVEIEWLDYNTGYGDGWKDGWGNGWTSGWKTGNGYIESIEEEIEEETEEETEESIEEESNVEED